jgi:hypothetical protein
MFISHVQELHRQNVIIFRELFLYEQYQNVLEFSGLNQVHTYAADDVFL